MSALGASISGLQASQKWLDVISNNVSNSNTVAYKEGRLSFADLISSTVTSPSGPDSLNNLGGINPSQLGLGVTVGSIQTIMNQGAIQTTGNVTDIAINGAGFFTVKVGSQTLYTRAGNLTFDSVGNLVTADGGLVQGWEVKTTVTGVNPALTIVGPTLDTKNTAAVGNIVVPSNMVLAPKATSFNASSAVKDQGVILAGNLDAKTPANALAAVGYAAAGAVNNGFIPDATQTFTVYDSLGVAHTMLMSWAQSANTAAPVNAAPSWNWYLNDISGGQVPNSTAYAAAGPGNLVGTGTGILFNADGSLQTLGAAAGGAAVVAPATTYSITMAVTDGAVTPFNFSINIGTPNVAAPVAALGLRDGMTGDFGNGTTNSLGVYTPVQTAYTKLVDGYPEGTLTGLSVTNTGGINATFSNGQIVTVAKLAMTTFTNPSGLDKVGGNYFAKTANSGFGQIGTAGSNGVGSTQGNSLEASNVDLTVELTNMILAQRMFESNARVVTSADSILNTLVNLGR